MAADDARKAVIADDDPVAVGALRAALGNLGVNVVAAVNDGKHALDECLRLRPNLVCLDIEMPEMKGLEVLSKLRRETPGAVILLITAHGTAQNVRDAMQLRADGVIVKPFKQERIASEVQRAFAKRQLKK